MEIAEKKDTLVKTELWETDCIFPGEGDKEGIVLNTFGRLPDYKQHYSNLERSINESKDAIFKVSFPRHIFAEGHSYCKAVKMVTNTGQDGDEIPKEHFV